MTNITKQQFKKKKNDPLSDSVEFFAVVWREEKKKEKESMCPVFRTVPGSDTGCVSKFKYQN